MDIPTSPTHDLELNQLAVELATTIGKMIARIDTMTGGIATKDSVRDMMLHLVGTLVLNVTSGAPSTSITRGDLESLLKIDFHNVLTEGDRGRLLRIASEQNISITTLLNDVLTRGLLAVESEQHIVN